MRLVLDTNTVVSGLLWKGPPHALLEHARQHRDVVLHTSPKLLAELADVLGRPKFHVPVTVSGLAPEGLMQQYLQVTHIVVPATIAPVIVADPDDDHVLACALARRLT